MDRDNVNDDNRLLQHATEWCEWSEREQGFLNGLMLGLAVAGLLCAAFLVLAIG